nr:FkbM family methyltransferase [Methylomarinum sp. Ch1-1]MDP4521084.1 FkbM family methyltransferase [Methylomarinum sp. Ch1-1]
MKQLIKVFFARVFFYRFNKLLYRLSLCGLGVLNFEDEKVSGESVFLKNYFKNNPGGNVFDVGANIGNYTRSVFKYNPSAKVVGFEPHPKTFELLNKNIAAENFKAVNAAAGEREGLLSLYDYKERDGSSHASLYKDVIENIHKGHAISHRVKVISLGDYIEANNIEKISLLKIDTEGHELSVLKGMKKQINGGLVAAIHFEFNEMNVSSRTFLEISGIFFQITIFIGFFQMVW